MHTLTLTLEYLEALHILTPIPLPRNHPRNSLPRVTLAGKIYIISKIKTSDTVYLDGGKVFTNTGYSIHK